MLLVGAAALLALTYLLDTFTRHGSTLTESSAGRFGWTLLIWASGAALVGYGRAALGHLGFEPDRHPEVGHWLRGVAVSLVVGTFSRSRQVRVGSAAVIAIFVVVTVALQTL